MTHINSKTSFAYKLAVFGIVLPLLWIGVYKFTPTEASLIEPLIRNHPLMSWIYSLFSVETVSALVGVSEIIVGLGLVYGFFNPKVGFVSGILASIIFITTISFIFTTPGAWKIVDGIPVTNFFLVKDITFLAIALLVVEHNKKIIRATKSISSNSVAS